MTYPDRIIQMNDHGLSRTGWWGCVRYRILAAFIADALQSGIYGARIESLRDKKFGSQHIAKVAMNFHNGFSEVRCDSGTRKLAGKLIPTLKRQSGFFWPASAMQRVRPLPAMNSPSSERQVTESSGLLERLLYYGRRPKLPLV